MNRYFTDAWYHLRRAGRTLWQGVTYEYAALARRFRRATRGERAPRGRLGEVRAELSTIERKVESRVEPLVDDARARIRALR